tara:strand:+ start:1420 stop:1647 length:228 start_codon:yes stop_codon:yes gene_type:complete
MLMRTHTTREIKASPPNNIASDKYSLIAISPSYLVVSLSVRITVRSVYLQPEAMNKPLCLGAFTAGAVGALDNRS